MSRKTTRKPTRRKAPIHRGKEWIGGDFPGPFHVADTDEPYRPLVVAWIEAPGIWSSAFGPRSSIGARLSR